MKKFKRILAFLIDHFIACFVGMLFVFVLNFFVNGDTNQSNSYIYEFLIFYYFLIILKEITFKNASIGKMMLKLQVKKCDDSKPNLTILILRNVFFIIWPIQLFVFLKYNKKIEDIIFKTKVVEKNK